MLFSRHLKWNEKKFNETLNDTRFGLKARVSENVFIETKMMMIKSSTSGSSRDDCIEIIG